MARPEPVPPEGGSPACWGLHRRLKLGSTAAVARLRPVDERADEQAATKLIYLALINADAEWQRNRA